MKWTHRNRIIATAVVLSMCTQILLAGIGILNAGKVDRNIEAESNDKLLNVASYNVTAYLSYINSMISYLQSNEIGEYVQSYLGFENPSIVKTKTDRVDMLLDQIHLADNLMDTVYILSSYQFQKSLVFHEGDAHLSSASIPTLNELELLDLLPLIEYNPNQPIVFNQGELSSRLKPTAVMSPDKLAIVKKFANDLEGRVIIHGGVVGGGTDSFVVIIVLKKDWLNSLVSTGPSTSFRLLDEKSIIIDETEPSQETNIESLIKTINPSGLKLMLFTLRKAEVIKKEKTISLKYLWFNISILLSTVFIIFIYSYYLILPFRRMSHHIKKQHLLFPLQSINKDKIRNRLFPQLSLTNHLLILFLLAVCIPAVSSGIAYFQFLNQFSIQQMKPYAKQLSQQISINIHRQSIIYEDLINELSLNHTFVDLLLDIQRSDKKSNQIQTPDISFLQYSGISDIAYVVLYNSSGSFSYSSQNVDILNLSAKTKDELTRTGDAVWASNIKDIYNQPTISLLKQVSTPESISNPSAGPLGYIQIVLNQSAFQSTLFENIGLLLTINRSGDIIYQNEPTKMALDKVKQIRDKLISDSNPIQYAIVNGVSGIATMNNISGNDWNMFFLDSIEPILVKRQEFYNQYLIVISTSLMIAMFLVYGLTRWFIRSLEFLKHGMEQQIVEVKMNQRIQYKDRDEISDLIDSYNQMMARINELMATNIQIAEENSSNRMKQQELLSLQTQTELKMLQMQINPHFLYNTLQNIGMRAKRSGEEEVSFMVYALADLFQYSIRYDGDFIDFSEEMRHTQNYIHIQEFRFKDKFTVEWNVSKEAFECKVIKFILQPLVENAISHGILNSVRKGKIWIAASVENNKLAISVKDNGVGIERQRLSRILERWEMGVSGELSNNRPKESGGVGLNNVYYRLQLLYNGFARMEISSERFEGTHITLLIPKQSEKNGIGM